MKAKIDLEKFICSMLNDSKTNAGYVHAKSIERALKEQGMEYKDGEIMEIGQEQPSEKDYEDLSIINEGDDGVLLYFTKYGRGISDFRISKDTARWLHGRLGEYLKMYDDEEPKEQEEKEDLRKWLNFENTHEGMSVTIPDNLKGTDTDGGVVGEKVEEGEPPTAPNTPPDNKPEHESEVKTVSQEEYFREVSTLNGKIRQLKQQCDDERQKTEREKDKVEQVLHCSVGCLDAVKAMLESSSGGVTHRMRDFYAEAMVKFIGNAKATLQSYAEPEPF